MGRARLPSLSLTHDGEVVDVLSVGPLAPGESQLVRLGSQLEVAGSNRFRVSIDADHLVDDNTAYLAIEVPDQLKVLVVEGREREARYLDLALRLAEADTPKVWTVSPYHLLRLENRRGDS